MTSSGWSLDEMMAHHAAFDLATWEVVEDASYYLLRTAELFPHAVIHRAGPISALPEAPRPELGAVEATAATGRTTLDALVERGPVAGFLVVHRGEVVYERYPRMRPFDRHLCWSVTKTFPAALVAMLEAEGRVDVREPVEAYLPGLAGTAWAGTPVVDILDMASGIDCPEVDVDDAYTNPSSRFYPYEAALGLLPSDAETPRLPHDYIATLKRSRPSGEAYEYTSVNTFVLGWLVEELMGQPFAEVVGERIWRRMGAEADAAIIVSPAGVAVTHGGISATLRDLARWGMLHTPGWSRVAVEPVLPDAYLTVIREGGRPAIFDRAGQGREMIRLLGGERPRHNTYQWDFVMEDGDHYKSGFRGQGLYVSPSRDLVAAWVGTQEVGQVAFARALAVMGML